MINRNFRDFVTQHKRNQNQVLFSSKNIKGDSEVLNLIDNFLNEKNSFIFESVEKGIIKGRYTIFGKKPDKIWEFNNNKFNIDSIKYLYSLSKSNFAIISDENNNIYVVKILNIMEKNISKSSADYANYNDQANIKIKDNMFRSYDFFLNDKYKVKINQKTLNRVKNYFR